VCSLTAWACGDNMDNGGQPDAGPPGDAAPGTSTAFIVSGDFSSGTGVASTIEIPDLEVTVNAVAGVASDDPVLRHYDGTHYIINRFNHDNITRVDAATNTLIDQIQTGPGSNPQDVAVKGSKLYVPALGTAGVVVIDTSEEKNAPVRLLNPSLTWRSGSFEVGEEGCLSLPGQFAEVKRHTAVVASYLDPDGKERTLEAERSCCCDGSGDARSATAGWFPRASTISARRRITTMAGKTDMALGCGCDAFHATR